MGVYEDFINNLPPDMRKAYEEAKKGHLPFVPTDVPFRCGHCKRTFISYVSLCVHIGREMGRCGEKGDNIGFRTIDKKDENKPRWSLLPAGTIEYIVAVLEFGARKYQVDNWQGVPDARRRYYDAVMRHIEAWWSGEKNDPETGLPHLAHAATCLLFLMWFDNEVGVPGA